MPRMEQALNLEIIHKNEWIELHGTVSLCDAFKCEWTNGDVEQALTPTSMNEDGSIIKY